METGKKERKPNSTVCCSPGRAAKGANPVSSTKGRHVQENMAAFGFRVRPLVVPNQERNRDPKKDLGKQRFFGKRRSRRSEIWLFRLREGLESEADERRGTKEVVGSNPVSSTKISHAYLGMADFEFTNTRRDLRVEAIAGAIGLRRRVWKRVRRNANRTARCVVRRGAPPKAQIPSPRPKAAMFKRTWRPLDFIFLCSSPWQFSPAGMCGKIPLRILVNFCG